MLMYELVNPSDAYTFQAPSREVAALVVGVISTNFAAETEDKNEDYFVPPFLFGGFDEWYRETFNRSVMDGYGALRSELADALDSFVLGNFGERKKYQAAIDAIDNPEKKKAFIERWNEGRTSVLDIGGRAHWAADALRQSPDK